MIRSYLYLFVVGLAIGMAAHTAEATGIDNNTTDVGVAEVFERFDAALRSRDPDPDELALLAEKALAVARDTEEEHMGRYMRLVALTLPLDLNDTACDIAWRLSEFVVAAQQASQRTQSLDVSALIQDIARQGQKLVAQRDEKMTLTNDLLAHTLQPSIDAAADALEAQYYTLVEQLGSAADTTFGVDQLKDLQVQRTALSVLSILSKVMTVVGGMLTGMENGVAAAGVSGTISQEVEELKTHVLNNADALQSFEELVPLLVAAQEIMADLEKVKSDSINIRAWLTSDKMFNFKTLLLLLAPDRGGAVLRRQEAYDRLLDVTTNIFAAMDEAQFYEINKQLAELSVPDFNDIDSEKYQEQFDALEGVVRNNVIVSNYRIAMRSLQLHAYPLCKLVEYPVVERCLQGEDLINTSAVNNCIGALFSSPSIKLISLVEPFPFDYDVATGSDNSFVTWRSAEHRALIADVLAGREVLVDADVLAQGHDNVYAVKFNEIALRFWHADPGVTAGIEAALLDFQMSLVHMGTSYFECGDGVAGFAHPVLNVTASYRRDAATGVPVARSSGYVALTGHGFSLSPYALWRIRLLPLPGVAADFGRLAAFAERGVDMGLVGWGTFVANATECDGSCVYDFPPTSGNASSSYSANTIKSGRIFNYPIKITPPTAA